MRTTVVIPDELAAAVREHAGSGSFSRFVREALDLRLEALRREALLHAMAEGYAAEAEAPSLDLEWSAVETEDLP